MKLPPLRLGLPVAFVMATATVLGYACRWTAWLGVWSETQKNTGAALILGLPAAAGLGAWMGSVNRAGGVETVQAGSTRVRWQGTAGPRRPQAWFAAHADAIRTGMLGWDDLDAIGS